MKKSRIKQRKRVNPKYKDRVFKFIFGNPANKEWTLSLYNSVNGSNHSNPDDIRFNTIDDAVYMEMKNDVSFIILDEMNLWEHQSSFSSAAGCSRCQNRTASVFTMAQQSSRNGRC